MPFFQVCTNGYVTFDTPYYDWSPPGDISYINDRTLLAPYFADVDIRGVHGEVYYQAYTSFGTPSRSSGKRVIQLANSYMGTFMFKKDFDASFVLVATWHEVPPYPHNDAWWCWWFGWTCEEPEVEFLVFQISSFCLP